MPLVVVWLLGQRQEAEAGQFGLRRGQLVHVGQSRPHPAPRRPPPTLLLLHPPYRRRPLPRSPVQQQLDDVTVALALGVEEGRPAEGVRGVDVRAVVHEVVGHLLVLAVGGHVQQRAAGRQTVGLTHARVDVNAGVQHGLQHLPLAPQRHRVYRGPALDVCGEHLPAGKGAKTGKITGGKTE